MMICLWDFMHSTLNGFKISRIIYDSVSMPKLFSFFHGHKQGWGQLFFVHSRSVLFICKDHIFNTHSVQLIMFDTTFSNSESILIYSLPLNWGKEIIMVSNLQLLSKMMYCKPVTFFTNWKFIFLYSRY